LKVREGDGMKILLAVLFVVYDIDRYDARMRVSVIVVVHHIHDELVVGANWGTSRVRARGA